MPEVPEHLLRRIDIHHRQVATEGAAEAPRAHDPAHGEHLVSLHGAHRHPAGQGAAVVQFERGGDGGLLIQVQADVQPGDSGGALISSDGQVVGMTT